MNRIIEYYDSLYNCLVPINQNSNWTLLSISGTQRTIEYYDSLYDDAEQEVTSNQHCSGRFHNAHLSSQAL